MAVPGDTTLVCRLQPKRGGASHFSRSSESLNTPGAAYPTHFCATHTEDFCAHIIGPGLLQSVHPNQERQMTHNSKITVESRFKLAQAASYMAQSQEQTVPSIRRHSVLPAVDHVETARDNVWSPWLYQQVEYREALCFFFANTKMDTVAFSTLGRWKDASGRAFLGLSTVYRPRKNRMQSKSKVL
jgi:hypothetical protein